AWRRFGPLGRRELETARQLVEPPQVHLPRQFGLAVALEGRDAREPLLERDARLQTGERLADALVIAAAEAQDARELAADVENFRVLEDRFVVVGRADEGLDHAPCGHLHATHLPLPTPFPPPTHA